MAADGLDRSRWGGGGTSAPTTDDTDERPRCSGCGKLFAVYLTRPWHIDCPRCGQTNERT